MDTSAPPSTLLEFHEDILLSILSYVADVPFELADSGMCACRTTTRRLDRIVVCVRSLYLANIVPYEP